MKILSILAILFGFTQCGSSKLVKTPPFKVTSSTYNRWVGGVAGVQGTRVEVLLIAEPEIHFDSLYFQKKSTKVEVRQQEEKTSLIAHFNTSNKKNLVLHSNRKKELKNEMPQKIPFPFELEKNQAVLSYQKDGKTRYFKIENVSEITAKHFQ